MQARQTTYWITTVLLCAFMALSAYAYLSREPSMAASFAGLGYPAYFPIILGVAKVLGLLVLLVPAMPLAKEWAYAGFTFTFIGAFWSHLVMNQQNQALLPVVALILLALSYRARPADRRLLDSTPVISSVSPPETVRQNPQATLR